MVDQKLDAEKVDAKRRWVIRRGHRDRLPMLRDWRPISSRFVPDYRRVTAAASAGCCVKLQQH
jgi:hypothetical protein